MTEFKKVSGYPRLINIKGFTDSTGSYSYNISVSEFGANTIKTYLVGSDMAKLNISRI